MERAARKGSTFLIRLRKSGSGLQVTLLAILIAAGVPACAVSAVWGQNAGQKKSATKSTQLVARGQYIVNDVAVCGQCHTPRDSQGRLIRSHWLEGAAVWFQPSAPSANWPLKAPRLAGTPPASEPDMIKLLTTGIWTNGGQLRPPMPQFRMTRKDAEAVVAYLKSLNPEAQH